MKNVIYASSYAIDSVGTGKNIRSLRIRNGMSVMDVSDFFGGIARNSIYKWERGETLPCIDNLYALAGLFRVSLGELVVGNRETVDRGDGDQSAEFESIAATIVSMVAAFCWCFSSNKPRFYRRSMGMPWQIIFCFQSTIA